MVFGYKEDYTIITMPLPSSGEYTIATNDANGGSRNLNRYGFESVESVHLMAEVERLAYADRAEYLGDADFFKVPVKTLISYPYVKERMKNFNKDSAGQK